MDAITALLQVLVAAWLLAQYLLQVAWLRALVLDASPPLLPWLLLWLGLPVAGDAPTQVPHLTLEAMLRMKALVLVATALRHKAQRWQRKLPPAVLAAAEAHWPCPLFWPPKHSTVQAAATAVASDGSVPSGSDNTSTQQNAGVSAAGDAAGGDSLPWEDLEPVLRRAGQLVSPVKAAIIQVSSSLSCSRTWQQLRFTREALGTHGPSEHSWLQSTHQGAPSSDAAVLLLCAALLCAACTCSCFTKWAW
jgi:hypothetical protein